MRTVSRALLSVFALGGASACSPVINETLYQNYEIRLWGPDLSNPAKASPDPFAVSQQLRVRIQLWEDSAGTKKYAQGRTLPEEFKDFKPEIVKEFSPTISKFELGDIKLPRYDPANQAGFFVTAEVLGLDETKSPIARARCPIMEVKIKTSGDADKVVCRPFFGLIGKWNTLEPLKKNRWQFGADAIPGTGAVVVGGGRYYDGSTIKNDLNTIEVFTPPTTDGDATGHWQEMPNKLSLGRFDLTATATGSGDYVMFLGGKTADTAFQDTVDKFNFRTSSMDSTSFNLTGKRGEHGAALLGADVILLAGGASTSSGANRSIEKVTPNDSADTGLVAGDRRYPCVTQIRTNSVLICGGGTDNKCIQTDGTGAPESGSMTVSRASPKCAAVGEKVYIVGGNPDAGNGGKKIEVWAEGAGVTTFAGELTNALTRHAVAASNGKVVVTGGYAGAELTKPLATGFLIDPAQGQVSPLAGDDVKMASKRAWHQMVGFADGTVMVIGGKPETPTDSVGVEMFVVPD